MKLNQYIRRFSLLLIIGIFCNSPILRAQGGTYLNYDGKLKWLRVNSLHTYFSEHGSETETGGDDPRSIRFSWPGEYGLVQTTMRARGMFLGCVDFHDAHINQDFSYYVINSGPKPGEYEDRPIYDAVDFRLVGRFNHPLVVVDDAPDQSYPLYDAVDELDNSLPADRMIIVKNHSSMGVTITKRIYAFTQQYHDNYYIYDYILKNTGILDNDSTIYSQTIKDFIVMFSYRYAMSGESLWENASGETQGWGVDNTGWGRNVVHEVTGTDGVGIRGHYAWYAPHSGRPFTNIDDDWGCPNENEDGIMAAARYVGHAVIHADTGPGNPADNPMQPVTTQHWDTDSPELTRTPSRYNTDWMSDRYALMTMGHPDESLVEEIAASGQAADIYINSSYSTGGVSALQGIGPFTLNPEDSIHIVLAGGVAGLSRAKNREVGGNWLQYYNNTGTPELLMPNGSLTSDYTAYKKAWVLSCRDSLTQTFQRALDNYNSGYAIPQPPPPPEIFNVASGGDRIRLSWSDNATSDPHFDGYVIYRAEGAVLNPNARYEKIFECNGTDELVHSYDDVMAVRGFNYYYYIQSKDDGTQNTIESGVPLYSSMFWTVTSEAAYLRRPSGLTIDQVRVVPNPFDIRARMFQFGKDYQYDRIAFYELPPVCHVKVYTERGDLIWEKYHDDGSGDELWDSMTFSRQIVVSGIYILYVEVPRNIYAEGAVIATRDYLDPVTGEVLISEGETVFNEGDLMYKKGDSVFRKFVIIR